MSQLDTELIDSKIDLEPESESSTLDPDDAQLVSLELQKRRGNKRFRLISFKITSRLSSRLSSL